MRIGLIVPCDQLSVRLSTEHLQDNLLIYYLVIISKFEQQHYADHHHENHAPFYGPSKYTGWSGHIMLSGM